ncbi:MAG: hypothetical protein QOK37_68 [Thermoanaerobaculia bacterium]|jgi:hypothetical protein|nr:hypothetical protein [Thermoanaerobaculia bacterium]
MKKYLGNAPKQNSMTALRVEEPSGKAQIHTGEIVQRYSNPVSTRSAIASALAARS